MQDGQKLVNHRHLPRGGHLEVPALSCIQTSCRGRPIRTPEKGSKVSLAGVGLFCGGNLHSTSWRPTNDFQLEGTCRSFEVVTSMTDASVIVTCRGLRVRARGKGCDLVLFCGEIFFRAAVASKGTSKAQNSYMAVAGWRH
jgi:hypothetical protein